MRPCRGRRRTGRDPSATAHAEGGAETGSRARSGAGVAASACTWVWAGPGSMPGTVTGAGVRRASVRGDAGVGRGLRATAGLGFGFASGCVAGGAGISRAVSVIGAAGDAGPCSDPASNSTTCTPTDSTRAIANVRCDPAGTSGCEFEAGQNLFQPVAIGFLIDYTHGEEIALLCQPDFRAGLLRGALLDQVHAVEARSRRRDRLTAMHVVTVQIDFRAVGHGKFQRGQARELQEHELVHDAEAVLGAGGQRQRL